MATLKQKIVSGAIWTLLEKMSSKLTGFVVGMILARILSPTDYGTVALTGIFFGVAGVLVDGGFGGALVQKKDADDLDFNSVFYMQLVLSLAAYGLLFCAAPWIAVFYQTPVLTPLVRVSALALVFNAINAVQNAELTKKMQFHLSFRISLIETATWAVVGVGLACMGYGVWALVWAVVVGGAVSVVARWFIIAWRPRLMFSWSRLKPLFSYGWKMAASGLIGSFFDNLNGLIIGKFYTKADLAFVNKGNNLPQLVMDQVDETLGRVSFPALVLMQNDPAALRAVLRRMIRCSTFLVFPLMVGVAACAKSELLLLYGEKWLPAAPYMQLACFAFALWPFHTVNLRAIAALGRSDVFLKLEIVKKALYVACILVAFKYGVFTFMAVTAFVLGPLSVIVNAWPNRKLLNYTIAMQLCDVMPTALVCLVEAAVVFGIDAAFLRFSTSARPTVLYLVSVLTCQFIGGALTFGLFSYAFKLQPMGEYMRMIGSMVERRRSERSGNLEAE